VSEMDKVVQRSAADAEESAATSREMSAEAGQMEGFVYDLEKMVNGASMQPGTVEGKKYPGKKKVRIPAHEVSRESGRVNGKSRGNGALYENNKLVPERVIPFQGKDFDF